MFGLNRAEVIGRLGADVTVKFVREYCRFDQGRS